MSLFVLAVDFSFYYHWFEDGFPGFRLLGCGFRITGLNFDIRTGGRLFIGFRGFR